MAKVAKRRGRYVLDFYDSKGKRRWITLPPNTTKAKAKKELQEIEYRVSRGTYLPEKRVPLFKDLAASWLKHKRQSVRASTWTGYEGHLRNHFERIDQVKVNRITPAWVEKFISKKLEGGMALTTLRRVLVTFNQVMQYAVRHRYIDHNPVRDAERPKQTGQVDKSEIQVLKPHEIQSLVDAAKEPKYRTLFMLAIMSGARQGEILGLKWTDVDWFNNQIRIQRTYNKGEWYKPKTRTSIRNIDLGPAMMKQLREWQRICPETDLDLIFPNRAGGPINQANLLNRHFFPALQKAGIMRIRFHDLRHTFASLLIDQGENIKYIQSQLGHSSPTVTLNVYAHLLNPTNPKSAKRLEDTIFSQHGSKMVANNKEGLTVVAVNP